MRNLKRAFSLVLALVMVLGMVTIAPVAAAEPAPAAVASNFTDAAEIKYTEAVAITGGIGLFAGTDGKFLPKGTVTRAQMATIIVKMLYGGDVNADSFKGNGKFSDTADFEGGWAEGYINWCSTLGVVAGYGDGTFRPGNQVTTAEAATMILNALKIDAGEGTWPTTVMSKATEEDFFEDLKPMPETNVALTREELAVIALNGLNWSDSNEVGWYVTGGTADEKMSFESYKDAALYAGKTGGQVQPLEGRDTLSHNVYDLKMAEGWIAHNQASGEKYTELVWFDAGSTYSARFNLVTDASMIGHKVELWYEEAYTSEKEPGKAFAIVEAAEYITLTEAVDSAKEYKAAFGVKYDLPAQLTAATDGTAYVKDTANANAVLTAAETAQGVSYVAGTSAPAGTYVINAEDGKLCGYIAPVAYTAAKIGYIDTTADSEKILVGSNDLSNSAEDDEVIEYDGIAKDDYVTYFAVQDVFVLAKMDTVTGLISKVGTNRDGKTVVTVDGKEYVASAAACTIPNVLKVADLANPNYQQDYTFYMDPNGCFVCYEAVDGAGFDMSNTFYLLGAVGKKSKDNYGNQRMEYFARGVDMTGNEALIPIGVEKVYGDPTTLVGTDRIATAGQFYYVEDTETKEEKELNLKKVVAFPTAYDKDEPNATYSISYDMGADSADWVAGGKFEYGVHSIFVNNGTLESGIYCYNHKGTKFLLVEGDYDQDDPLDVAVHTENVTVNVAGKMSARVLLTRQSTGLNNIEAMVFPMDIDQASNATIVYVPQVNSIPDGTDSVGNVYSVYEARTGEPMEITVDSAITSIPAGFYSVGYDSQDEIYKLALDAGVPVKVPAATNESTFEQKNNTDGRLMESVLYDIVPTAFNGSTMWISGYNSATCSGVKVIDPRTDEQVAADGVARLTSMDQVWALRESMPWVKIEMDLVHTAAGKIVTAFVEVYNNKQFGTGTVVYGTAGATQATVVSGEMHAMGAVIDLPVGKTLPSTGFYTMEAGLNGNVTPTLYELPGTTGCVLNGDVSDLPAYDALFNATGDADLDDVDNFDKYGVVEYILTTLNTQKILVALDYGTVAASSNTLDAALTSADFDAVMDLTANGVTESNIVNKQNSLCMAYTTYTMNGDGSTLLVVTAADAGVVVNTVEALNAITAADVYNKTRAEFTNLAELQALAPSCEFIAKLYTVNGVAKLVVTHCVPTPVGSGATLEAADFATNGSVKLDADVVTIAAPISVASGKNFTLDLNGKTLSGTRNLPVFNITGGTLTITDTSGAVGADWTEATGGTGTITYSVTTANSTGVVRIASNGTFILDGGTLTGANIKEGVVNVALGTFNMNGGAISGNKASVAGGAVYLNNANAKFNMANGLIADNEAVNGGAIYVKNGDVTISGGEISGNKATGTAGTNGGGAIFMEANGDVTISGGVISGNEAVMHGGAVHVGQNATLTVAGGEFTGNKATTADKSYGGAIYVHKGATLNMSDGEFTGNESAYRGGAITGQEAASSNVTMNITGGTIENNTAANRGANFYTYDATVTLKNVTVGAGTCAPHTNALAGVMEIRGGTFTIEDVNVATTAIYSGSAGAVGTISGRSVFGQCNVGGNSAVSVEDLTSGASINFYSAASQALVTLDSSAAWDGFVASFAG